MRVLKDPEVFSSNGMRLMMMSAMTGGIQNMALDIEDIRAARAKVAEQLDFDPSVSLSSQTVISSDPPRARPAPKHRESRIHAASDLDPRATPHRDRVAPGRLRPPALMPSRPRFFGDLRENKLVVRGLKSLRLRVEAE